MVKEKVSSRLPAIKAGGFLLAKKEATWQYL
jgi:hypothetical protein